MPQTTKFFFYLVVICQILLNVTFINSAVIRREQRSLTTNGTVSEEISDRDFEPETSIGLEDEGNLLLEMPSFKDDTTTKNSIQDTVITTLAFGEEKKEDTTLTGLRLDENTVGLSLDNEQESFKVVKIQDENKTVSAKSKNEETTTEEMVDKSTITKIEETTTIIPSVIENDRTTSKKEEEVSTASTITKIEETTTKTPSIIENDRTTSKKEEADVSTASIETSTQLEVESNVGHSNDNTKKEDIIGTTVENSPHTTEDTTRVMSTALEETTKVSVTNTTLDKTTSTEVPTTTIPVENDSATKLESLTTNATFEEVDKVTEPLHVQKDLVDTSTELADNDISKTFATNEHKENLMDEKEVVTTESVFLAKDQNMATQKMSDDTLFTKAIETTQPPTSTEEFSEQDAITTVVLDEDFKKMENDVKPSNSSSTEKRGKFIANNYSSFNDFHLPNTSDVWALAGLRSVGKAKSSELQNSVETSEEKSVNSSMVATKSLHDWTRVMDNTHDMESKPFMKIVENTEDPTTETATSIMEITHGITPNTTVKTVDVATDFTTEMPVQLETTETRLNQDNEVELSTTRVETEPTNVTAVSLKDKFEREIIANPTESQNTNNDFETTTDRYEQPDITTTDANPPKNTDDIISTTTTVSSIYALANHEKTIEENKVDGDSFEKETISLPTTTTTTTTTMVAPIPQLVTVKIETTDSLPNGEITREANAGTTSLSTSSLSDFTTSIPFLTSTAAITKKTTMEVMTDVMTTTTPPVVILNTDYEVNEPSSSTAPSKITMQTTSPATVTTDSSAATPTIRATTTTTMPSAVTVIETLTETQTTTEEPHTPAIISNDTMIQKSNNNNYNEYEVVNKSTENYADNSSTEAFEATTRVGLQSNSPTIAAELPTTEVDKLDEDLNVTTVPSFENNNAYDIESTTIKTTTVIGTVTLAPKTHAIVTDPATAIDGAKTSTENLDHIDPIHNISDTAETSIESNVIDPLQVGDTSTTATATATATTTTTTTTKTTESNQENMKMPSTTTESGDDDSIYSISTTKISTTTTTSTPNPNYDESATTFESISTKKEDVYSIVPTTIDIGGGGGYNVPKSVLDDYTTTTLMPPGDLGVGTGIIGGGDGLQPMDSPEAQETDVNVIIAISVSTVGIIALILLVAFLYVMRKRQKQMSYGQRCRPVSLDAYSLDNVSVYNSVRRKGATLRASKRSYGNVAFDDPSLRHNVLGTHELARYVEKKSSIWDEFKEVPQIIARADEVPAGCEDKNRYANVIPLPETRVILQQQNGDEKSEYINANYVRGPKDTTNYYIACQAPLETTVNDFWRMIWEQNSRVIIMATDLIENGIDKCAEYLPPSVTLDNHTVFGDYQVTLKHREVKEKYAISTLMLKNTVNDESREITHYWYQWPEAGVPTDEAAIIAMLLEARSSLKAYTIEQCDSKIENATVEDDSSSAAKIEINGNVTAEKPKPPAKDQGPLTIHCSPGTGRTGTILACDIAMRCLEEPKRTVDIPQTVYSVRRGRASAVQTKEQYEFIYKVTHMYATKISNINNDN